MHRRTFLARGSGLLIAVALGGDAPAATRSVEKRLGMSTVTFRNRFQQTKSSALTEANDELTLLKVPAYYRKRFGVLNLEFWSNHFESLERTYLQELRAQVNAAGAQLVNIQVDADYDLASTNEAERQRSLATAREWIDAAAFLGSRAVRINPGRAGGSVERSIVSMQEVNRYCVSKGLPLLTENHFGLEMDPEVHLRIRREAGPNNLYTLPDFGNYPIETMWDSLEKILPHAYLVSAKTVEFNEQMEHISYDFDRCIQLAERSGFKGIYSVEQWSRTDLKVDEEKVVDWMLQHVRSNI
jgi:sugar phosphate isomerase/epimerase